jgi:hypothetical protein
MWRFHEKEENFTTLTPRDIVVFFYLAQNVLTNKLVCLIILFWLVQYLAVQANNMRVALNVTPIHKHSSLFIRSNSDEEKQI